LGDTTNGTGGVVDSEAWKTVVAQKDFLGIHQFATRKTITRQEEGLKTSA